MTRPGNLPDKRREHLGELIAACSEMTVLARLVHNFAQLMGERRGGDLDAWIADVRKAQLPELAPLLTGFEQDHDPAMAGLTQRSDRGCECQNEADRGRCTAEQDSISSVTASSSADSTLRYRRK
ncbi:hypothetical protein [Streptomyces sp. Tue6028]|uniref:hypothetical protein n=1 Tax=Streptomyces sp. Tue6028 TaxID=2036037 RepID=UPI003D746BD1